MFSDPFNSCPASQRHPGRPNPDFAEFIIGPAEGRTRWLNPAIRLRQRKPHGIDFVWNSKISSFRQNPHLTALVVLLYRPPVGHGLTCPFIDLLTASIP